MHGSDIFQRVFGEFTDHLAFVQLINDEGPEFGWQFPWVMIRAPFTGALEHVILVDEQHKVSHKAHIITGAEGSVYYNVEIEHPPTLRGTRGFLKFTSWGEMFSALDPGPGDEPTTEHGEVGGQTTADEPNIGSQLQQSSPATRVCRWSRGPPGRQLGKAECSMEELDTKTGDVLR